MTLPYLSAYHTLENSQGTLDPLGLYSIADRLALRLVPGFRERMSHPRYLTAIAVGSVVCSSFDKEELAADEISPPWQVYEWYVTSALVKRFDKTEPNQLVGMPGREKTTRAMKDGFPMSAAAYLKTPNVFGFHGVYRTLAKSINLIDGDDIGEFGVRLVDIWEQEQGLEGFRVGKKGTKGYEFRIRLEDAVKSGMKAGAVAKSWTWDFYNQLAEHLAPKSPGKEEARLIYQQLLKGETTARATLIEFIRSDDGMTAAELSEKALHTALLGKQTSISELLEAIQAYEKVCRVLYNAFYSILQFMQYQRGKISVVQMSGLKEVEYAFIQLPAAFQNADNCLVPFTPEAPLFTENFQLLRDASSVQDWVRSLLEHHFRIQKNKPPSGKAAWILEYSKDLYLLNTQQRIELPGDDDYVHLYRTNSILSFLQDLKKL